MTLNASAKLVGETGEKFRFGKIKSEHGKHRQVETTAEIEHAFVRKKVRNMEQTLRGDPGPGAWGVGRSIRRVFGRMSLHLHALERLRTDVGELGKQREGLRSVGPIEPFFTRSYTRAIMVNRRCVRLWESFCSWTKHTYNSNVQLIRA